MTPAPAGVALAAGEGRRLRPLTTLRPKALCPVGGRALLDLALDRLAALTGTGPDRLAVNAHHLADQVVAHCAGRVTVRVEPGEALGTAGGLGALRDWLDGRAVLVTNADSYLPAGLVLGGTHRATTSFASGWDGERSRLLCLPAAGTGDFRRPDGTALRYLGACLLPWAQVARLRAEPSGLYEVLWREADARGALDLVTPADLGHTGGYPAIDCGTPAGYLAANLHASGGASIVGAGAEVLGRIERCVVWDGARVGPDEHLVDCIRAGDAAHPVTVPAAVSAAFG